MSKYYCSSYELQVPFSSYFKTHCPCTEGKVLLESSVVNCRNKLGILPLLCKTKTKTSKLNCGHAKPYGVTTQMEALDEYILMVLFVLLLKRVHFLVNET